MGILGKLFGKKSSDQSKRSDFFTVKIKSIKRLTKESVQVTFDTSSEDASLFQFVPGQYINVQLMVNGNKEIRSYSICSGVTEELSIGVKKVENGTVSSWFNDLAKEGEEVLISIPQGNFMLKDAGKKYVAFAAGSGITPILSMAKGISSSTDGYLRLFFANKTLDAIMFHDDLVAMDPNKVFVTYSLSKEEKEGFLNGRFTEEMVTELIKSDLSLLKSEGFYICGPEEMILSTSNALKQFGVADNKIHFELFTAPVLMKSKPTEAGQGDFKGMSNVTVILDEEEVNFDLSSDGDTILNEAEGYGIDAPFSCRGGVCCTCKAKVLEGKAVMDANMSLTDSEIEEGYVLTCQAHPASEKVIISYDE